MIDFIFMLIGMAGIGLALLAAAWAILVLIEHFFFPGGTD